MFTEWQIKLLEANSPNIDAQVDIMAANIVLIKKLEEQIKGLKGENADIADLIEPVIREMKDRTIETQKSILHLEKISTTKVTVSWAKLWKTALTKVNSATRKVLEELRREMENISNVSSSWSAMLKEDINEGIVDAVKLFFARLKQRISGYMSAAKDIKKDTDKLAKLINGL